MIAALDTRFDPAETAIAERMLREYAGTIPDAQLVEEIALSLACRKDLRESGLCKPLRRRTGESDGSLPLSLSAIQPIRRQDHRRRLRFTTRCCRVAPHSLRPDKDALILGSAACKLNRVRPIILASLRHH